MDNRLSAAVDMELGQLQISETCRDESTAPPLFAGPRLPICALTPFLSCDGASCAANSGPSVLPGRSRVTLSRLWCYAGIRQVLPGSQSRRRPETHRHGQPLQSEARSAKNAPESAICGVLPYRPTPTGSVLWLIPISNPRSAPRRLGRTILRSDALPSASSETAPGRHDTKSPGS